MSLFNKISNNLLLPVSDILTGYSVANNIKFLQQSQFWSREQIDCYQNQKLRELISHAYQFVPYYKELFKKIGLRPKDIQNKNDLYKIPILSKNEIKKNKDKFLSNKFPKNDLIFSSSSGSTGEPIQFFKTKQSESMLKAALLIAWSWMGYNIGDKYVKLSMNPRSSLIKKIQDLMNNCLYISSTQISFNEFNNVAKEINIFDPQFIRGYPVPLLFLASNLKINSNIYTPKSLRAINTTGSTLLEAYRYEIESVFGVKVYDSYSCEGGTVFSQCPNRDNYHPIEQYSISEYITDNFTYTDAEKPQRHITTDLHNHAFPFIRYDTQDYVVLGEDTSCLCGRKYKNIKKIKGRDSDVLITPSGKYLIVENFVAYFEWISEVDQIQVIQDKINEIEINMIVNNRFTEDIKDKILKYWEKYVGDDVRVKIKVVDEISLTPTGKRRTVIRNPNISLNG